ncbi:hypothetical protein RRG08_022436 [Elysia crispata]|uniref:Secreted protein n=1 Tax=Elysia crispata TaxID=231223 RepID=A0AAE0Z1L8_9GAST|nr:hypothetical protein RRG08_022436 [Elysia crispata]
MKAANVLNFLIALLSAPTLLLTTEPLGNPLFGWTFIVHSPAPDRLSELAGEVGVVCCTTQPTPYPALPQPDTLASCSRHH